MQLLERCCIVAKLTMSCVQCICFLSHHLTSSCMNFWKFFSVQSYFSKIQKKLFEQKTAFCDTFGRLNPWSRRRSWLRTTRDGPRVQCTRHLATDWAWTQWPIPAPETPKRMKICGKIPLKKHCLYWNRLLYNIFKLLKINSSSVQLVCHGTKNCALTTHTQPIKYML